MLALLDGDLISFRCAATCENENEAILHYRINDLVQRILDTTQASKYYIYLSGKENFRKLIDPEYKANRLDKPRPKWLPDARDWLKFHWGAKEVENNFEADDAMGVEQCQNPEKSVICSLDKDMLMIPGEHYNWHKDLFTAVSELEGLRHFYKQLLIGDSSDNIKGIHGVGPVKAAKLIDNLETEKEMYELTKDMYDDDLRYYRNCNLLWIHQDTGELWTHRSKHLFESEEDILHAEEVLLPLKTLEAMEQSKELGSME